MAGTPAKLKKDGDGTRTIRRVVSVYFFSAATAARVRTGLRHISCCQFCAGEKSVFIDPRELRIPDAS